MQLESAALEREPVEAERRRAAAANRPDLVGQMLLDQRNLGLHREFDVRECAGVRARRHTGQDPTGTLLVHEAASAVDWVDNEYPAHVVSLSFPGNHDFATRQTFRDQQDGPIRRGDRPRDLFDKHVLGDAIDRVDRVSLFFVARDARQRGHGAPFARLDDIAANPAMQGLNGREKRMVEIHAGCER